MRKGLESMPEERFHDRVNFFGQDTTKEAVLLQVVRHAAEHLGQAVAYARMNGIAPPWS
jgi:hypothetical protein